VAAVSSQSGNDLKRSRWFTRGWTLQELLAPKAVKFFGIDWKELGDKKDLSQIIARITKTPEEVIGYPVKVPEASIAQRMLWAAGRMTTRQEDIAYYLLGMFAVNMPLLYGEDQNAFIRLQEEIIKISDDQSLFAWNPPPPFSIREVALVRRHFTDMNIFLEWQCLPGTRRIFRTCKMLSQFQVHQGRRLTR
jgi:hypothetical protein